VKPSVKVFSMCARGSRLQISWSVFLTYVSNIEFIVALFSSTYILLQTDLKIQLNNLMLKRLSVDISWFKTLKTSYRSHVHTRCNICGTLKMQ
jgi:hypothetical protein